MMSLSFNTNREVFHVYLILITIHKLTVFTTVVILPVLLQELIQMLHGAGITGVREIKYLIV
jgi:hypothetical protein